MKLEKISLGNFKEINLEGDFIRRINTIRENKNKIVLVEFSACLGEYLCGMINLPENKENYFLLEPVTSYPSTPLAISYGAVNKLFVNEGHLHHPH